MSTRRCSKLIAKYAFKLLHRGWTASARLHLTDDGYLVLIDGKNPQRLELAAGGHGDCDLSIGLAAGALLPLPGFAWSEDLLRWKHANLQDTANLLSSGIHARTGEFGSLGTSSASTERTRSTADRQAHGGDFDGDMICVIDGGPVSAVYRFPFQSHRASADQEEQGSPSESDWYNIEAICDGAMGKFRSVSLPIWRPRPWPAASMKTSYVLVPELSEGDSTASSTTRCADRSVLKEIRRGHRSRCG